MLVRPPLAGETEARLHLVEDEEGLVLVGEAPKLPEELGTEVIVAALALDGLDDDRGDVVRIARERASAAAIESSLALATASRFSPSSGNIDLR